MKKIACIIKPYRMDDVRDGLNGIGVPEEEELHESKA